MTDVRQMFAVVCVCLGLAGGSRGEQIPQRSCFLLTELGGGQVVRRPVDACQIHVTPASTFKVPHALAALDSGVVTGPDEQMKFPGGEMARSPRAATTRWQALIRHSVLWYFQAIAQRARSRAREGLRPEVPLRRPGGQRRADALLDRRLTADHAARAAGFLAAALPQSASGLWPRGRAGESDVDSAQRPHRECSWRTALRRPVARDDHCQRENGQRNRSARDRASAGSPGTSKPATARSCS